MIAQATTIIDVYRDATAPTLPDDQQTYDTWGDEVETPRGTGGTDAPYLSGVKASLIEHTQRVIDPTTGDVRRIRHYAGRVTGGIDIQVGDIVADRADGARYAVRESSQPKSVVQMLDVRLDLERVG